MISLGDDIKTKSHGICTVSSEKLVDEKKIYQLATTDGKVVFLNESELEKEIVFKWATCPVCKESRVIRWNSRHNKFDQHCELDIDAMLSGAKNYQMNSPEDAGYFRDSVVVFLEMASKFIIEVSEADSIEDIDALYEKYSVKA